MLNYQKKTKYQRSDVRFDKMIRNILFSLFFFSGIIFISIIFLPTLFLPQKFVLFGGKLMGHWSKICLKIFLSTKIIV